MGAATFTQHHNHGGLTLRQAFANAMEEAACENGHGGYTGSLAEKNSVVQVQPTPLPIELAYALAQKLIDDDDPRITDKWGPAGAIPIEPTAATRTRTVTVTVRNPTFNYPGRAALVAALPASTTRGRTVLSVRVIGTPTLVYGAPKVDKGSQPITTRYEVTGMHGMWNSIAEARKAAVDAARAGTLPHVAHVRAVTTRGDDSTLLTITPTVKKWTAQVEVVTAPPVTAAATDRPSGGWLFFGWASC